MNDGVDKVKVNFKEFNEKKKEYFTSPLKFIKREKVKKVNEKKKTIEQEREELVRDSEILKKETNGLINLAKQGGYVNAALFLFKEFCPKECFPKPIKMNEGNWINNGTFGPLIFAEKYEGRAFKYDFCSHYPAIMSI